MLIYTGVALGDVGKCKAGIYRRRAVAVIFKSVWERLPYRAGGDQLDQSAPNALLSDSTCLAFSRAEL